MKNSEKVIIEISQPEIPTNKRKHNHCIPNYNAVGTFNFFCVRVPAFDWQNEMAASIV